jgi:hypothetical protein
VFAFERRKWFAGALPGWLSDDIPATKSSLIFGVAIVPADGINAAAYSLDFGTFR